MVTVTLNPAIDQALSIPRFRPNTVNRVATECRSPGGKGINVASFLADYGVPTVVTGFLGTTHAELFEAHFTDKGLENRFVRIKGATRTNLKILNQPEREVTDINFPGLTPTSADLAQLEATLDALAQDHEWFVLSGSLPPGLPAETWGTLAARLRRERRRVLLDTADAPLRLGLKAKPNAVKPNTRELESALDRALIGQTDLLNAGRGLVRAGIEWVIISRGADGALFVTADEILSARHEGPAVIQTTVGAGDALVAGYLASQQAGLGIEGTARLAIAFSIAALQRTGPTLPGRRVLDALAREVEVERLT
jgi:1-phosphofructokinase family hexose kinase